MLRSSIWALSAEGVRLLGGLVVFFVLARMYSPGEYGTLMGTYALMWLAAPLASGGSGLLLVKRISAGESFSRCMATAVGTTSLTAWSVVAGLLILRPVVLPQSPVAVFLTLGLVELWAYNLVELVHWGAQALDRLEIAILGRSALAVCRGAAAIGFFLFADSPPLWQWPVVQLFATLVAAGIGAATFKAYGHAIAWPRIPTSREVRTGMSFAAGFLADEIRMNLDSLLLLRLGYPVDAGHYTAAYRLVQFALAPLRSLIHASNARIFSVGRDVEAARRLAARLTIVGVACSAAQGAALGVGSPWVPDLLGDEYAGSVPILRVLAMMPTVFAGAAFASGAVTAVGLHHLRLVGMVGAATLSLVLNLALIPVIEWRGAALATLISGTAYAVWVWLVLQRSSRSGEAHGQ